MANCYIKWFITANKGENIVQMADLNFYDASDQRISYPSGTVAETNSSTFSNEGANNILDGNSSTKMCGRWVSGGVWIKITVPDETFISQVRKYNYCTANDSPSRDPITWTLSYSFDDTNYTEWDSETSVSITSSRYTQTQIWSVKMPYKPSGQVVYALTNYTKGGNDAIHFDTETPTGTSISVFTKVGTGSYVQVSDGDLIPNLPDSSCTLYIMVAMSTTNVYVTPSLDRLVITSDDDSKVVTFVLNVPNITPAIGNAQISYDGLGALAGAGGPTDAFIGNFTPSGMTWKGNQNDEEHVSVSITPSVLIKKVTYHETQEEEHAEIIINATVVLTDIHDL